MTRIKVGFRLFYWLCASLPALAQTDLSGSWAAKNHEDAMERGPGPNPVDFTGLPLNEAGRARAESYSQSQLSEPERVCAFYTQWHLALGPFGIKIWNETDAVMGKTVAWVVGGWETRGPMIIWMDGRPHPSAYAPHSQSGFTTGSWNGAELTAYTTHMKSGYLRRNGAPISDRATMTTTFLRHGDILTLALQLEDPVYLSEPYLVSRSYVLTTSLLNSAGPPCISVDEGVKDGVVPHYLPGKNPFMDEMTKIYGIPREAVMGGPQTMYPAFRDKIKDKFVSPPRCKQNCQGVGETTELPLTQ